MPSTNSSARSLFPERRAALLRGAYVSLHELLALRHHPSLHQPPTVLRHSIRSGARLSKQRGRGIDFAEVRLYQPGDDVRTIDWRVTARKNKPHTKVFREERERPTLIVVDQSQSLFFGSRLRLKSVAAAEFAAIAAWQGLAGEDRVGGLVIGNTATHSHKPMRSGKAVARLLADLAASNRALDRRTRIVSNEHYATGLGQIRRLVQTGYRLLVISDFLTATDVWRDTLGALARHNQLTLLRLYDPLERELPPAGRYTLTDGAIRWQFHTGNANLRRQFAERHREREADLATFCANHMIRYAPYATDEPPRPGDWQ